MLVRINALPALDVIEQGRSRGIRVQQYRIDIVALQNVEQQVDVLEEGRVIIFEGKILAIELRATVDEDRDAAPDQISAERVLVKHAFQIAGLDNLDGGSGRMADRRQIVCA